LSRQKMDISFLESKRRFINLPICQPTYILDYFDGFLPH